MNNNNSDTKPRIKDYWIITPHMDSSYDTCCFPVDKDPEGRNALGYAKDVLEQLWDSADDLNELNITVSIKREQRDEVDILDVE